MNNNNQPSQASTIIVIMIIVLGLLSSMTSCRAGYGCRGNQSWGKMVNRINSFN